MPRGKPKLWSYDVYNKNPVVLDAMNTTRANEIIGAYPLPRKQLAVAFTHNRTYPFNYNQNFRGQVLIPGRTVAFTFTGSCIFAFIGTAAEVKRIGKP